MIGTTLPRTTRSFLVLAFTALLTATVPASVEALKIELTSGEVRWGRGAGQATLAGPDFSLESSITLSDFVFDSYKRHSNPTLTTYPPGTLVGMSGASILGPFDGFEYDGVFYRAPNQPILVTTDVKFIAAALDPVETEFTLKAKLHGTSDSGAELDVKLIGTGVMTATFEGDGSGLITLFGVRYTIEELGATSQFTRFAEIAEPSQLTLLLVGSALGFALIRRR